MIIEVGYARSKLVEIRATIHPLRDLGGTSQQPQVTQLQISSSMERGATTTQMLWLVFRGQLIQQRFSRLILSKLS